MRKLLAPIALVTLSLAIQGCASKPTDLDENVAHKPEFQDVAEKIKVLYGRPSKSTTWGELMKEAGTAYFVCLEVGNETYDDGISAASDIAQIIRSSCLPYEKAYTLAMLQGKEPVADTAEIFYSKAVKSVLEHRAKERLKTNSQANSD